MAEWGFSVVGLAKLVNELGRQKFDDPIVWEVNAGEDLRYATYVEYGTKVNFAQPYMYPAVQSAKRNSDLLLADAMVSSQDTMEKYTELLARHVYKVARKEVPVDTGDLKDSIQVFRIR